jgi:hypothetical protein
MLETDALRTRLAELASVLRECDEETMAAYVSDAAEGTEAAMNAFLASNELWGGPGSVADQAGMRPGRTDARRRIEAALVRLGAEQTRAGVVNIRTGTWVATFDSWAKSGI